MDALSGWTIVSLRPASQQAAVRRAIAAYGATPLALPALRLAAMPDAELAAQALRGALLASCCIYTSPAAVRFARRLLPASALRAPRSYALGRGTAQALVRQGVAAIHPDERAMRSEGLLALPEFSAPALARSDGEIGLVTAPGGRGLLLHALRARGARVRVAEVYRRLPPRLDRRHADALRRSRAPRALLLTSAEALEHALAQLPVDAGALLRACLAVASSPRLADVAHAAGFDAVIDAGATTPRALLDALAAHARGRGA
jgi:uroporphyrinogen-III synthase